jgi:hypothetical protein
VVVYGGVWGGEYTRKKELKYNLKIAHIKKGSKNSANVFLCK